MVEGKIPVSLEPDVFCEQAVQGSLEGWDSILVKVSKKEDEVVLEPRSLKGTFKAVRVPLFALHIQEPGENAPLILARRTASGEVESFPIEIRAQVVRSDTNEHLAVTSLFKQPTQAVKALLMPEGRPQQAVETWLTPDVEDPSYLIGTLTPQDVWQDGTYTLVLQIVGSLATSDFAPAAEQFSVELQGFVQREVQARLAAEPSNLYLIRSWDDWTRTFQGKAAPLSLQLNFVHRNEAIPLSHLFTDPPQTLQATLRAPDGSARRILLQASHNAYITQLKEPPAQSGGYEITLTLNSDALSPSYIFESNEVRLTFQRTEVWWSSPWSVRVATFFAALLLLLFGWAIKRICFSGPAGLLEIRKDQELEASWPLHVWFSCLRNRFRITLDIGEVRLRVRKAPVYGGDAAMPRIQIWASLDGEELLADEEIEAGETVPFTDTYYIGYVASTETEEWD